MRRLRPLLSCLCLAMALGGAPAAHAQVWAFDSARSRAAFDVRLLYLFGLHGDFGTVRGALRVDRARNTASVDAQIDANDLHMRSLRYEGWAKSAEFFDASHFPQIAFSADPFPLSRLTAGGAIEGTLTIRGNARHATFQIDHAECDAPLSGACAVVAQGALRRSDFGMRSRRGALSDKVALSLSIYVEPVAPQPAR